MLRFPQRELGFHEKNPEGQAIIFGTGIIRNSSANPTTRLWIGAGLIFGKKGYLFEYSRLPAVILSNGIGWSKPPISRMQPA
jgi:hypothetical protein